MKFFKILFSLTLFLLLSCNSKVVTIKKSYYAEIGKIKNDKKVGKWKYLFDDGKVFQIGKFKNNLETGEWKIYHSNGRLRQEGNFKNGKIDGLWKFYHENGILYGIGNANYGDFEGNWNWYFQNGQIHTVRNYEKGKLISVDFTKNFRGQNIEKGTLVNGNGTLIIYETETLKDSIISVLNYENGKIK